MLGINVVGIVCSPVYACLGSIQQDPGTRNWGGGKYTLCVAIIHDIVDVAYMSQICQVILHGRTYPSVHDVRTKTLQRKSLIDC